MIGKKNIVFGFLYLVFTAALGIVMVNMYDDYGSAALEKQSAVGRLQQLKQSEFEEDLEPLNARQIAIANTDGILAMNKLANTEFAIDMVKGGPHAHGNLESLLNIVVGIVLCFLAINAHLKQLISWIFILGTILHSGMLYLGRIFDLAWANTVLGTGVGPVLLLLGLAMIGIAAAMGFRGELVKES